MSYNRKNLMTGLKKNSSIFQIFQENIGMIRNILHRFSINHHDVADLTQETILRALEAEKRTKIQEPRRFLVGIAKNVARRELQKKSQSLTNYIENFQSQEYVSNDPAVDEIVSGRQQMAVFEEAIKSLPAQCRRVFIYKYAYGFSHKEISKKLEISISTVEKHVALGLKRSRQFMLKSTKTDKEIFIKTKRNK